MGWTPRPPPAPISLNTLRAVAQFSILGIVWESMRDRFTTVLVAALLPVVGCGSNVVVNNNSSGPGSGIGPGNPPAVATWSSVPVPNAISSNGASYSIEPDGYLYAAVHTGALPNIVNSVLRTSAANPGTWTDITGIGLSTGSNFLGAVGMTPNGTILVSGAPAGGGVAYVFAWNGSTSSPVWTQVTGWTLVSSSRIYGFTNDSAGYTYFSPAWSGDIWRNDSPNSLNFTRVVANLYGVTNGGATGHPTNGGIYAISVFNLNDGKGDMMWACGEGELDNISLNFSSASNTAYLTTAKGYTGNCTAIDKSPTTILALRQASSALDSGYDTLTAINIATRATTVHAASYPRSSTGFPGNFNMNLVGLLHWVSGTTWIVSSQDASNPSLTYLLISTDDGNTWTDMTAGGGIDSSCTGVNLSVGAVATSQYVYARCQLGAVLWRYGPLS